MKHTKLVMALAVLAWCVVSCKPETEKGEVSAREGNSAQLDRVKKESKEAAQAATDYAYAQKAEFVEKMQSQLVEINRGMDELAAKIEKSSAEAQAEAKPKLQALREQAAKLNTQLDAARNATESTWEEVKAGFKKAYGELKDGFQEARQWASDKIKP